MNNDFENFQQQLKLQQNKLEMQAQAEKKAKEDQLAKNEALKRQKQFESDQRAAANRLVFERAGVVQLFEHIRDKKIVIGSPDPFYKREEKEVPVYKDTFWGGRKQIGTKWEWVGKKISDYTPAEINWGDENANITLSYNIQWSHGRDKYFTWSDRSDDHITLSILRNGDIGIIENILDKDRNSVKQERKIEDIPAYVAQEISKTMNKNKKL